MGCFNIHGIWVNKRAKWRERSIFRPNQCAIGHDSGSGLEVWACCGSKINWEMPRRLGIILVLSVSIFMAIWVDKQEKWCVQGTFGPNQCVIAHDSRGGPGVQAYYGLQIDRVNPFKNIVHA